MSEKDKNIIDSVPGIEPAPVDPPRRGVVVIPEGAFRGDPSKVIGHPSNPTNDMSEAYSRRLKEGAEQTLQHPGEPTFVPPITEVPSHVKNPPQS
jgi:hypothetical protein